MDIYIIGYEFYGDTFGEPDRFPSAAFTSLEAAKEALQELKEAPKLYPERIGEFYISRWNTAWGISHEWEEIKLD